MLAVTEQFISDQPAPEGLDPTTFQLLFYGYYGDGAELEALTNTIHAKSLPLTQRIATIQTLVLLAMRNIEPERVVATLGEIALRGVELPEELAADVAGTAADLVATAVREGLGALQQHTMDTRLAAQLCVADANLPACREATQVVTTCGPALAATTRRTHNAVRCRQRWEALHPWQRALAALHAEPRVMPALMTQVENELRTDAEVFGSLPVSLQRGLQAYGLGTLVDRALAALRGSDARSAAVVPASSLGPLLAQTMMRTLALEPAGQDTTIAVTSTTPATSGAQPAAASPHLPTDKRAVSSAIEAYAKSWEDAANSHRYFVEPPEYYRFITSDLLTTPQEFIRVTQAALHSLPRDVRLDEALATPAAAVAFYWLDPTPEQTLELLALDGPIDSFGHSESFCSPARLKEFLDLAVATDWLRYATQYITTLLQGLRAHWQPNQNAMATLLAFESSHAERYLRSAAPPPYADVQALIQAIKQPWLSVRKPGMPLSTILPSCAEIAAVPMQGPQEFLDVVDALISADAASHATACLSDPRVALKFFRLHPTPAHVRNLLDRIPDLNINRSTIDEQMWTGLLTYAVATRTIRTKDELGSYLKAFPNQNGGYHYSMLNLCGCNEPHCRDFQSFAQNFSLLFTPQEADELKTHGCL